MFRKFIVRLLLLTLPLCGTWMLAQGGYIHAKARVAQILLKAAWTETLDGRQEVKPWPWADTWPVARLSVPRLGIHRIVLAGANGSALAFGPGHLFASTGPEDMAHVVIAGHRDTHFAFLKDLQIGDRLELETSSESTLVYEVSDTRVVNERDQQFLGETDERQLTLLTCYPFNAITTGGEQRFLVIAKYKVSRTYI